MNRIQNVIKLITFNLMLKKQIFTLKCINFLDKQTANFENFSKNSVLFDR